MSRSAPGPPPFLTPALYAVKRIVRDAGRPITDEEIRDALLAEGFSWPMRDTFSSYRRDSAKVTLPKVRRVTRRLHGYGITRDRASGGWIVTPK